MTHNGSVCLFHTFYPYLFFIWTIKCIKAVFFKGKALIDFNVRFFVSVEEKRKYANADKNLTPNDVVRLIFNLD